MLRDEHNPATNTPDMTPYPCWHVDPLPMSEQQSNARDERNAVYERAMYCLIQSDASWDLMRC